MYKIYWENKKNESNYYCIKSYKQKNHLVEKQQAHRDRVFFKLKQTHTFL